MPPSPDARSRLRVAVVGHHEPDYPRNIVIKAALAAAGIPFTECHSRAGFPWRHAILAWKLLRVRHRIDLVFVTEGGHRLVPLLKVWSWSLGMPVVFDPFLSRYNTRVEDRRLHRPGGLQALICLWQDWSSTQAADGLIFDTAEHRDYFFSRYRLAKPAAVVPVGVDEAVFRERRVDASGHADAPAKTFEVLFYGTYIPLQGIEHILHAAAVLQRTHPDIRFSLVGTGQTHEEMRALATTLGLVNLAFEAPVSPAELREKIARADVCLGIFGTTLKAGNVVPNKVIQAAAVGSAIITCDSTAIRRYFRDGESAFLVAPGNAEELAAKILFLRDNPAVARGARGAARKVFERFFSVSTISRTLADFLRGCAARRALNS